MLLFIVLGVIFGVMAVVFLLLYKKTFTPVRLMRGSSKQLEVQELSELVKRVLSVHRTLAHKMIEPVPEAEFNAIMEKTDELSELMENLYIEDIEKPISEVVEKPEEKIKKREELKKLLEQLRREAIKNRDVSIQYHDLMYVGKDYTLKVQFLPPGTAEGRPHEKGVKEIREGITLIPEEEPILKVIVSGTAFEFDKTEKEIRIRDPRAIEEVTFIVTPKKEMGGDRKIEVVIKQKDTVLQRFLLDVKVVEYIVDHITPPVAKMLGILDTVISIASGVVGMIYL